MLPLRSCIVDSDCGLYDCGGGYFSDGEGQPCFNCMSTQIPRVCGANAETYACLSVVGWIFTVVMTYVGFAFFFVATFWNADLVGKLRAIRDQWRALRRTP